MRNLRDFSGCSRVQAIEAASLHPAQALGMKGRVGSLDFGARADIVLLNDDLQVQLVFVGGRLAYTCKRTEKQS